MKSKGTELLELLEQRQNGNKLCSCVCVHTHGSTQRKQILLAAEEQDVPCRVLEADVWHKEGGRGALWHHCLAASGYLSQAFS